MFWSIRWVFFSIFIYIDFLFYCRIFGLKPLSYHVMPGLNDIYWRRMLNSIARRGDISPNPRYGLTDWRRMLNNNQDHQAKLIPSKLPKRNFRKIFAFLQFLKRIVWNKLRFSSYSAFHRVLYAPTTAEAIFPCPPLADMAVL